MFDVCIIGSGPAGGVLSKELAEAGAKVALIEAGRTMLPEDFQYHAWPYELPFLLWVAGVSTGTRSACVLQIGIFASIAWKALKKIGRSATRN